MRDVELSPIRHTAGTSGGGFGDMVTKPVTPRSQESRAPGEARVPLSPHPPRQEIDPRLEILIENKFGLRSDRVLIFKKNQK